MNIARYCCGSFLFLIVVVSLVGAFQDWDLFKTFMKWGLGLWVACGILAPLQHVPLTFVEWLGGGSILFMGGAMFLFDFVLLLINWDGEFPHIRWPRRAPRIPVVDGELVPDYPELPAQIPQREKLLATTIFPMSSLRGRWVAFDEIKLKRSCQNIPYGHEHYVKDGFEFCDEQ